MYSILLTTLAILLLAALPTLPYSAAGRARYDRGKLKDSHNFRLDDGLRSDGGHPGDGIRYHGPSCEPMC
jgi:hypothetical protein